MQPFYGLAKTLTSKNVGALVVVLVILLIIPISLRLTEQRVSTNPQAAPVATIAPQTSLLLQHHSFDCKDGDPTHGIMSGPNCNQISTNQPFAVDVIVHSDLDAANLVNAKITFNPAQLMVDQIIVKDPKIPTSKQNTNNNPKQAGDFFVALWAANSFKNDKGLIQLVGSVPTPGFITPSNKPAVMARIYFKAKQKGQTTISFDKSSSIYRNADNQNILKNTENLQLEIK